MLMLSRKDVGTAGIAPVMIAVMGMALILATPAVAGDVYSWQTENGEVAFTDNPKKIPARYRSQAQKRAGERIQDYAKFSSGQPEATNRYAEQLAKRVEYLRELNADRDVAAVEPGALNGVATINVHGIDLRLPGANADAPIIVENVRVLGDGQITSRHDSVVRQGGRTLAIVRGRQEGEVGSASNILDEKDLEFYR
jgi:hypothetical protein